METKQASALSTEALLSPFALFPAESKVWIYQANRKLNEEECKQATELLEAFLPTWNAHKSPVKGTGALLENVFLVLVADERQTRLSGCAMDQAVALVKSIDSILQADFFNRFHVALDVGGSLSLMNWDDFRMQREAGKIAADQRVFNHLHPDLGSLRANWIVPASASWHWRV